MNTYPATSLVQQWVVVADECGTQSLVIRWVRDAAQSDAADLAAA